MECYLDNSATTRVAKSVVEKMEHLYLNEFGNPSSMHLKGVAAEKYIKEAKTILAKTLKATEKEILFTSGGTESNNWALIGTALANRRKGQHLITTKIEHAAVKNPMKFLEEMGYEVTYLSVDEKGHISLGELEEAIREDTILVSIIYVNNEIGAVQPIEKIGELIKRKNPSTIFHVDGIQAYGKYKILPKKMGIDLMSISGHKFHGPKGTGVLYIKEGTKIKPIIFGGGQQNDMRSGTENVPGAAGIAEAARLCYENFEEKQEHLYKLREHFISEITQMEDVQINGEPDRSNAPHIVSASFLGIRSEVLLHSLEDRGIYVSAGSACSSHKMGASGTLSAIGLKKEWMESTVRFSFSVDTTIEEIDFAVSVIKELIPKLRKYTRR